MSYAKNGSIDIYYETYGEGEPLIFAHGAGGNAACWWQQIPCFSEHFRTIAFDHRGFARSHCSKEAFDVKYFADDLRALMDKERIESAPLVCQSMGGWTGLSMALTSPERVRALVMSHTPGGISSAKIKSIREKVIRERKPLTSSFAHWALARDFPEKNIAAASLYNQLGFFNTELDLPVLREQLLEPRVSEMPEDFTIPTLFITANQDQVFPVELIECAAAMVPGATVKVLGDAGHSSYFEVPDLFNQTVFEFLNGL